MAPKKYQNKFTCVDCLLCSGGLTITVLIGAVLGGLLFQNNEFLKDQITPTKPKEQPAPLELPAAGLTTDYGACSNKASLPTSIVYQNVPVFRCPNDKCLPNRLRCNYESDCTDAPDASDEAGCDSVCPYWVQKGLSFKCKDETETTMDGKCHPIGLKCNGMADCADGSDEEDCGNTVNIHVIENNENKTLMCTGGWSYCDGKCIPQSYECDSVNDCKFGNDESNCEGKFWDLAANNYG